MPAANRRVALNPIRANKPTAPHTLTHTLSWKASIAADGIEIDTVMSPLTSEIKLHSGQLGATALPENWSPRLVLLLSRMGWWFSVPVFSVQPGGEEGGGAAGPQEERRAAINKELMAASWLRHTDNDNRIGLMIHQIRFAGLSLPP